MAKLTWNDYERILTSLRECVSSYYEMHLSNTVCTLFLTSGEKIYYKIPESKISHLLGVDTKYLSSSGCLQTTSYNSIDVLNDFIKEENQCFYINKFTRSYLNYENVFSDFIEKKINIFKDNVRVNIFQLAFVAKLDRNKCHQNGIDLMKAEYLLCSKTENGEYLVLGLAKEGPSYVPITSQVYEDFDELKNKYATVLEGQELTIPTSIFIKTDNYLYTEPIKVYLKPNDKLSKVEELAYYCREFNANANITNEHIYTMKNSIHTYKSVETISSFIETGKHISADDIQYNGITVNGATQKLIDSYNDLITFRSVVDDPADNNSYSSLQKENTSLKNELIRLRERIKEIELRLSTLSTTNETLEQENNLYRNAIEQSQESFQKVLSTCFKK